MKSARKKSKKNQPAPIPKIFRKPMLTAGIMLVLDVLALVAAAVLNAARENFTADCYVTGGAVIERSPYEWYGIVAAALLVAAAAVSALLIAGSVLRGKARKSDMAFEIAAAALLLCLSAGTAGFSAHIVNGKQPVGTEYAVFSYEERSLIFAEEQYKTEYLLKIYYAESENTTIEDGTPCEMLVCVPLAELTDGGFEERYSLNSIAEDIVQVGFMDGLNWRELQFNLT